MSLNYSLSLGFRIILLKSDADMYKFILPLLALLALVSCFASDPVTEYREELRVELELLDEAIEDARDLAGSFAPETLDALGNIEYRRGLTTATGRITRTLSRFAEVDAPPACREFHLRAEELLDLSRNIIQDIEAAFTLFDNGDVAAAQLRVGRLTEIQWTEGLRLERELNEAFGDRCLKLPKLFG